MQAPMTPEMMSNEQAPQQEVDDVTLAKQALGLDTYEQQLQAMQAQLQESQTKAMFNEVSTEFKDVDVELVNAELAKMSETNPQMAEMMKSSKDGLEMLFRTVQTKTKPVETPDEITDTGDSGSQKGGDINSKIKNGTANELELGDFIIGL